MLLEDNFFDLPWLVVTLKSLLLEVLYVTISTSQLLTVPKYGECRFIQGKMVKKEKDFKTTSWLVTGVRKFARECANDRKLSMPPFMNLVCIISLLYIVKMSFCFRQHEDFVLIAILNPIIFKTTILQVSFRYRHRLCKQYDMYINISKLTQYLK